MKVSSTQDLYNYIMKYIRTHGRLVFGATVLLCLICYLGWRESAWSEVEHLESPIQSRRESDALGQNTHVQSKDEAVNTNGKSIRGDKKHRGQQKEKKSAPVEEDTGKGKLVFPIRNVVRPYPLVDTFTKELTGASPKAIVGADANSMGNMKKKDKRQITVIEGSAINSLRDNIGRSAHNRHAQKHAKETKVQLLGIIQGEVPVAVVDINGNTHTVYEGDMVDGVQVYTIHNTKVQVRVNGTARWIE